MSKFRPDWRLKTWHWLLIAAALVCRLAWAWSLPTTAAYGVVDGQEYRAYAESLMSGNGDDYPRTFNMIRSPGYPLFLIPFLIVSHEPVRLVQTAQAFLGIAMAILLARMAGAWAGSRAGDWELTMLLFHPFLIHDSAYVLTETLFAFLLWASIACLSRLTASDADDPLRWIVWAALLMGLACLTRPALQLFLVAAVLWVGWQSFRLFGTRAALSRMTAFTAVVCGILLPWQIGNLLVHGEFTLAPRYGLAVLTQSNSALFLKMYEASTKEGYYQALTESCQLRTVKDGAPPDAWRAEMSDFLREQPLGWFKLLAHKIIHFWTPWLNPLLFPWPVVLATALGNVPLFVLGGWEAVRRWRSRDPLLYLLLGLIGIGALVYSIFFLAGVRYRTPFLDITLVVLASSRLANMARTAQQPVRAGGPVLISENPANVTE